MGVWTDGWMDGCKDGWMDVLIDGFMDVWMKLHNIFPKGISVDTPSKLIRTNLSACEK